MLQQDMFSMLSIHVLEQMQNNPITWADSENMNRFYQGVMHTMQEENVLSPTQRQVGGRLCIRINATQLKSLAISRKIDISALKCVYFTFSTPQPLRVLFSTSIMRKYSRLATFLLQVKAVESAIVKASWIGGLLVIETVVTLPVCLCFLCSLSEAFATAHVFRCKWRCSDASILFLLTFS